MKKRIFKKLLFLLFTLGATSLQAVTRNMNDEDSLKSVPQKSISQVLHGKQTADERVQTVNSVDNAQLITAPTYNIYGAAQGRLAGLNISFTGDGSLISSYGRNVRNSRQTLFMVDGIERDFFSINAEQIESITVMKDALSTVLLGQRSASGVVNIITKKGDFGAPRFSFTVQSGFEQAIRLPEKMNAADYAEMVNEAFLNDNPSSEANKPYSDDAIQKYRTHSDLYLYPDVDWYSEILRKSTPVSRYNFNVGGSSREFRYYVDLDYLREDGLLQTTDDNSYETNAQINRFLIRSNLGVQVTPSTYMQVNLFGRQERYNEPAGGLSDIFSTLLSTPVNAYPVFNPDGTMGGSNSYQGNTNLWGRTVHRGYQFNDSRDLSFDATITQELNVLLKGLYLQAVGSYTNRSSYSTTRQKDFAVYAYQADGSYMKYGSDGDMGNSGSKGTRLRMSYLKGMAGYRSDFGKHGVDAVILADLQQIQDQSVNVGYLKNFTSYAVRLNYNFDKRYVAEVAASRGGYNWYAKGHRWENYWAAGLSWNVHNESFIMDSGVFSTLKLRATYGITGQPNTNYGEYIQQYVTNDGNIRGGAYGLKYSYEGVAASILSPEKAAKQNAGLDIGLFNDKLTVIFDYYNNKYTDIVATPTLTTALLGNSYSRMNSSEYSYSGHELTLTWRDRIRKFDYYITGIWSLQQSNIDYLQELPYKYAWQSTIGSPIGMTYGYVAEGLFQNQAEIDACNAFLNNAAKSTVKPGDIRYKDLNEDGVLDSYDQTVLGSKKAKGYYGFSLGFGYSGFDFNIFFQGTVNQQKYMSGDFMHGSGKGNTSVVMTEYIRGRWTPDHPTDKQTRLWWVSNANNNVTSSFWIYDSDYLRLKNMEAGYTLPNSLTRKIGIPCIRIFVNGMNLLTFSELYKLRNDIDPEAYGANYPVMRTVNFGINVKL
jgi:TonB-linked SusC/RagA family outer membrane protein